MKKEHGKVRVGGRLQDNEAVGTGAGFFAAKPQGEDAEVLALELAVQVFRDEEGIARAVHFGIAHLSF